jgi:prephenate dehydrogenase
MKSNVSEPWAELASLNVAIVGLGLMGGSLAMALRGATGSLIGIERVAASRADALKMGIVDEAFARLADVLAAVDLVVLAIPVESIVSGIRALPAIRASGCMVFDLGSTKGQIGRAMEELPAQFAAIGGHPMCGRESSGLPAATADLFLEQTFILCRNARTTPDVEAVALALVAQVGARPLFMEAADHDRLVAASSHLPYTVASLLMERAWEEASADPRLWQVSSSGLRDTTRLAGSNPEMMLEIMLTNQGPILAQLEAYGQDLETMLDALRRQDREALRAMLEQANQRRQAYLQAKYGPD